MGLPQAMEMVTIVWLEDDNKLHELTFKFIQVKFQILIMGINISRNAYSLLISTLAFLGNEFKYRFCPQFLKF